VESFGAVGKVGVWEWAFWGGQRGTFWCKGLNWKWSVGGECQGHDNNFTIPLFGIGSKTKYLNVPNTSRFYFDRDAKHILEFRGADELDSRPQCSSLRFQALRQIGQAIRVVQRFNFYRASDEECSYCRLRSGSYFFQVQMKDNIYPRHVGQSQELI
jgi:hypothetical protein